MDVKHKIWVLIICCIPFIYINSCCDKDSYMLFSKDSILVQNIDNSGNKPIYPDNNRVNAEAFGIELEFYHTLLIDKSDDNCECGNLIKYENNVSAVNIYCLNNFDSTHLTNSNINEYFFWNFSSGYIRNPKSLNSIINEINNANTNRKFNFLLIKEPILDSIQKFIISIELDNKDILVDTTEMVTLY